MSSAELEDRDRVVITGYGVVTAAGPDVESSYEFLKEGKDGIQPITGTRLAEYTQFKTEMGAPILNFDLFAERSNFPRFNSLTPKDLLRIHLSAQYVLWAAIEAQQQAGLLDENLQLDESQVDRKRAGIRMGTSIGGAEEIGPVRLAMDVKGKRVGAQPILQILPERVASVPSMAYKYRGSVATVIGACATSLMNEINGADILTHRRKRANVMLVGGTDAVLSGTGIAIFEGAGATDKTADPSKASRPFHAEASGLVMGEGAGVMVLETLEHAKKRGAVPLAEIAGYWESSDAYHDTEPSGEGAEDTMRGALIDAGVSREDKISVDAHATSTPLGDGVEVRSVKNVFNGVEVNGAAFYPDQVVGISSRKGALGHTLAAAGAIESIMAIRGMRDGVILPNLKIDAETQLPETVGWPMIIREAQVIAGGFKILKNSFGFGGLNASVVYQLVS